MSILWRTLRAQALAALLAFALALLLMQEAAVSVLLGGVACLAPGLYPLFQHGRPGAPGGSGLGLALKGEAGRLALTLAIFGGVFAGYEQLNLLALFGVFAGLQCCYGLVPYMEARRLRKGPGKARG